MGLFSFSGVKFTTARCVAEKTLARILDSGKHPPAQLDGFPRPAAADTPSREAFEDMLRTDRAGAAATIRCILETEAVVRLDDLLLRRTDWGMDPRHAQRLGHEVAKLLGWEDERRDRELRHLEPSTTPVDRAGAR